MKTSDETLEKSAENALRACLSKVPFLRINNIQKDPGIRDNKPDLLVQLSVRIGYADLSVMTLKLLMKEA